MTRLLRDVWDRFLLYFPLVSMGLLASGTYWLVRTTPPATGQVAARPARHEPDYFMENFSLRTFDAAGRVRTEVVGDKARHFPDTLWLEIEGIRVRSFDERGRMSTATAQRGLTNEDSSELQLMGNAVVVREAALTAGGTIAPRIEYRSEYLHAYTNTEQLESHQSVELIRGGDRFTADRLQFDNVEQVLQLSGRVKGSMKPPEN